MSKNPTTSSSTTQTNPNQGYVDWANQQSQNQYNAIQPATTQLLGNFNNPSSINPLLTAASSAVENDINGTSGGSGPFTSLKNNLLGTFDTGTQQNQTALQNQLKSTGLLNSGPGMAVLANAGNQAAQQRGLLGSQVDTQELGLASQLGQQTFSDQLESLAAALGILPPQVQNVGGGTTNGTSTTQTPFNTGGLLGTIAGAAIPAILTGGASLPASAAGLLASSLTSPSTSASALSSGAYSPLGVTSLLPNANQPVSLSSPYQQTYYS